LKHLFSLILFVLMLSLIPAEVMAEDYAYHPVISDRSSASVGYMHSSNSFSFSSESVNDTGDDIDFNSALDVSDSSSFLNDQIRWKFGSTKKWSISAMMPKVMQFLKKMLNG